MKRSGFIQRRVGLARSAPLRQKGKSDSALIKDRIQDLLRAIVIVRDGGCVLRNTSRCNGHTKAGELILQADHLITRANSATYADYRLVVCVCKGHHGWKKWHERQYNDVVKTLIEPERVALWEACERDSWRPKPMRSHDWQKEAVFLKTKLRALDPAHPLAA